MATPDQPGGLQNAPRQPEPQQSIEGAAIILVLLALVLSWLGMGSQMGAAGCFEPGCEARIVRGVVLAAAPQIPLAVVGIVLAWLRRRRGRANARRPTAYAGLTMLLCFAAGIAWVISSSP